MEIFNFKLTKENHMKILEMENASLASLRQIAAELNVPNANRLKKENLIINIRRAEAENHVPALQGVGGRFGHGGGSCVKHGNGHWRGWRYIS